MPIYEEKQGALSLSGTVIPQLTYNHLIQCFISLASFWSDWTSSFSNGLLPLSLWVIGKWMPSGPPLIKLSSILKNKEIDCRILIAHKSLEFKVRQFKVCLMHIFIQRWMIGKAGVEQGHNLEKKLIYIEWLLYIWYRSFSFF